MNTHRINRKTDGSLIHEGMYPSIRSCLESAIESGKDLSHADLRHAQLSNASLDGARMRGADFTGANLTGANLSEADLAGCCFNEAAMYNACLCWSNLSSCNFHYASFGATDIAGAILNDCNFSGLSTFSLIFQESLSMKNCTYVDLNGQRLPLSWPPLVVMGLERNLSVLDQHLLTGNSGLSIHEGNEASSLKDRIFIHKHNHLISQLLMTRREMSQPKVVDKRVQL